MLATDKVAAGFQPGNHASTFGGNPLVCAAGVATLETILEDGFILDQCNRMSAYFIERLEELKTEFPALVREVRGRGLLLGIELTTEGDPIVRACLEKGFLINCTAGTVLRFIPPLIVQGKDIDQLINALRDIFSGLP
jgi:acetylornithine/succinyldiaminopimelate/putrescine aminotransferase